MRVGWLVSWLVGCLGEFHPDAVPLSFSQFYTHTHTLSLSPSAPSLVSSHRSESAQRCHRRPAPPGPQRRDRRLTSDIFRRRLRQRVRRGGGGQGNDPACGESAQDLDNVMGRNWGRDQTEMCGGRDGIGPGDLDILGEDGDHVNQQHHGRISWSYSHKTGKFHLDPRLGTSAVPSPLRRWKPGLRRGTRL